MPKALSFIFLLFAVFDAFGLKRFTISGTIKDKATGEQLIGATVR